MNNPRPNPYVGPRPFDATRLLPARKQEVLALRRLLIATRVVLLHSPSGAGKTSLIEAQNGLRADLGGQGFVVRPTLRINAAPPPGELPVGVNRYELAALGCLSGEPPERLAPLRLAGWLDAHLVYAEEEPREPDEPQAVQRQRELLIFDQFEEILTLDPGGEAARRGFFDSLAAVLADPFRFALFVIREDYLGALAPWARRLPMQLASRFRIDLLSPKGACEAIREPARAAGVEIDDDALGHLVDELSLTEVQRLDGTLERQPGLWIEPVVLQVVCLRLWSDLAPEAKRVGLAEVKELGDVDRALSAFYAETVASIAQRLELSERTLRDWIGTKLISPRDVRIQVMRGADASEGLDNRAIEALEGAHLVRGEERRHVKWYELSHDRLVAPVRADNQRWQEQNLHPVQVQAVLWAQRSRPVELLLSDDALAAAEVWAARDLAALTDVERSYLEQSRDKAAERARVREAAKRLALEQSRAREAAERLALEQSRAREVAERLADERSRRVRQLKWSALVLAVAFVAALVLGLEACRQKRIAQGQTDQAKKSALVARDALFVASARAEDPTMAAIILRETTSTDATLWRQAAVDVLQKPIAHDILRGHKGPVNSVAFNPTGSKIVSGSDDNTVRIWDADGQGQSLILRGHASDVYSVAFSSDGNKVVSSSEDKTLRIWNADGQGPPLILRGHDGPVYSVACSPGGNKIVSGSMDNTVRIWNADGQGPPLVLRGHEGPVFSVAFSPDGNKIVSGSGDKTLRLWNADGQGPPLVLRGHDGPVISVAFSSDGNKVVSGSDDNTVRLWNADGQGQPLVLNGHERIVNSVAFNPDGSKIVSGSADNTVRIWNANGQGQPQILRSNAGDVNSVAFSPDGKRIASGAWDKTLRIWNTDRETPQVLRGHEGVVFAVAFSRDDNKVVSGSEDRTLRIWNSDGRGQPRVLRGHAGDVNSVLFSPDDTKIVSGAGDNTVRIWNADGQGQPRVLRGQGDSITAVAFSRDGNKIVSGSRDNTVWIWNADGQGQPQVLRGHTDWVYSVAFSPDGRKIVSGSEDRTLRLWNADGQGQSRVLFGHEGPVYSVAFSPDGSKIASGSWDKTLRIWNTDSQGPPLVLRGHEGWVTAVAFSPDGNKIVSGSGDNTLRIWNTDGQGPPLVLRGPGYVTSVAFSSDGHKVVFGCGDNTLRIWTVTVSGEALRDALWAATTDCLPIDRRMALLLETQDQAQAGHARCLAHPRGSQVRTAR